MTITASGRDAKETKEKDICVLFWMSSQKTQPFGDKLEQQRPPPPPPPERLFINQRHPNGRPLVSILAGSWWGRPFWASSLTSRHCCGGHLCGRQLIAKKLIFFTRLAGSHKEISSSVSASSMEPHEVGALMMFAWGRRTLGAGLDVPN